MSESNRLGISYFFDKSKIIKEGKDQLFRTSENKVDAKHYINIQLNKIKLLSYFLKTIQKTD